MFRPNQHLSNKGIKQAINSRGIVMIGFWAYRTAYYDAASATEDWLYLLDLVHLPSPQPNWSDNFCFFSAGKILEAKRQFR